MTKQQIDALIGLGVAILMAASLGFCHPPKASAHDQAILECDRNIKVEAVTHLSSEVNPENGFLVESYDRNKDGKLDIQALSLITGPARKDETQPGGRVIPHRSTPIFWIVDLDLDGEPDMIYVDLSGRGACHEIVPYIDLHAPVPELEGEERGPLTMHPRT